jgi:hypothetical protein
MLDTLVVDERRPLEGTRSQREAENQERPPSERCRYAPAPAGS